MKKKQNIVNKMNIEEIKIGDYVKVKEGIKAPDFEYQLMTNWQGKVVDIQKDENLVEIEWDSETLLNTPEKYLKDLSKKILNFDYPEASRRGIRQNFSDLKDRKPDFYVAAFFQNIFLLTPTQASENS